MTPLDRPVWQTLQGYHARFSVGSGLARRFQPDVNMFASPQEDTPEAMSALADLVEPGETVYILQAPGILIPDTLIPVKQALGVQMVYRGADLSGYDPNGTVQLTPEDAPDMLALATLTEPGPFLSRTHEMGRFIGVKDEGRLVAMAGERMRFGGFTEVSGVCTHPDYQGRGLAAKLSALVAQHILARQNTPFLHAWADNAGAIRLYEKLGFEIRCDMHAAILSR
ncbi:MAG: GNAT family N-acetyltransferase [Alphaproteobacteria bacterium]|nr:GNAT family N-acetyltransferase [Alphaproteobacteria bacterium]